LRCGIAKSKQAAFLGQDLHSDSAGAAHFFSMIFRECVENVQMTDGVCAHRFFEEALCLLFTCQACCDRRVISAIRAQDFAVDRATKSGYALRRG